MSSQANVLVSIVIVNWNTKEDLLRCLKSIYSNLDQEQVQAQIVVIDNASLDGSADEVQRNFPNVKLIRNDRNYGLAYAWNQGHSVSKGKYVIFLNPDILIEKNCVEELVSFLEKHQVVGAVGPKLISFDGDCGNYGLYVKFPSLLQFLLFRTPLQAVSNRSLCLRRKFMGEIEENLTQEVDQPPGAFIMIRKRVLDLVNGADSKFFLYYEDVDLAYRIYKSGWKLFYIAESLARHRGRGSTDKVEIPRRRYLFCSSACKYFHKHFGLAQSFVILLLCLNNFLLRVVKEFPSRPSVLFDYLAISKKLLGNWRYK